MAKSRFVRVSGSQNRNNLPRGFLGASTAICRFSPLRYADVGGASPEAYALAHQSRDRRGYRGCSSALALRAAASLLR